MNRLAGDKIKGLLQITGISLSMVVITATLLRLGLDYKSETDNKLEATRITLEKEPKVVSPVR